MDKREFFDACENHDWFFDLHTEANDTYKKGLKQYTMLRAHAYAHDNLYKIFKAFQDYYWDTWLHGQNAKKTKPQYIDF